MLEQPDLLHLATQYHQTLPDRIRRYLNARGISDAVIDLHLLGWNGDRITIPIFRREGGVAFFKLAKDPEDVRPGPKVMTSAGGSAELYGWERVRVKPCQIVICEGEFDRLVLESNGFASVTSTGGAGVFRTEWAEAIREIPEVYVCFDRDEAGRSGGLRVARMIPQAKIVELPEEVGDGGDVTDYFVRLGKGREDFEQLLGTARPAPPQEPSRPPRISRPATAGSPSAEVARIKERIPIDSLVARYVPLRKVGKNLVGLCPFHNDRHPSLVVSPERRTYRCFACNARGDVIDFLMRFEKLTFPEAVQALQHLAL